MRVGDSSISSRIVGAMVPRISTLRTILVAEEAVVGG
jgi:hypothetical protein